MDFCGRELCLVQCDDYTAVIGRALSFSSQGQSWPAAVDGTSTYALYVTSADPACGESAPVFSATGSFVAGPPKVVNVDVSRTETCKLTPGRRRYWYALVATLAGGQRVTLAQGDLTVTAAAPT